MGDDVRLNMISGNSMVNQNDIDKAIGHYLQAAVKLLEDGYFSRVAAVYRQILSLDDSRIDIRQSLARVYVKLGLDNEAAAQYQKVAALYERNGQPHESLKVALPGRRGRRLQAGRAAGQGG